MSKEEKNAAAKVITKAEAEAKFVKHVLAKQIPAKHFPAVHVLSTIDVLMDNLRRNNIEDIAYPWDR